MQILITLVLILASYLLGSVCTAIFICRLFNLPDPRTSGSSNPGATNVMRLGGKLPAILTLFGDALKGIIPILIARNLGLDETSVELVMLAAILGHIFPIFFKFKGGKAVATTVGGLLAFNYILGLAFIGIWILVVLITKLSSLGALVSAIFIPIMALLYYGKSEQVLPLILIPVIILITHRANIERLLKGQEPKVGEKR